LSVSEKGACRLDHPLTSIKLARHAQAAMNDVWHMVEAKLRAYVSQTLR
jgi:hypothetical protein